MTDYFTLAQIEDGNPVPIVAENVGPYPSQDAALACWPGFHVATIEEVEAYERYWEAWYVVNDPGNSSGEMGLPEATCLLAKVEQARVDLGQ